MHRDERDAGPPGALLGLCHERRQNPGNRRPGTILATARKAGKRKPRKLLVRKGGLEPPRFYPPDPKSGASANSATFARLKRRQRSHCSVRLAALALTLYHRNASKECRIQYGTQIKDYGIEGEYAIG